MNENNQETHLAIRELAAEMRSFRQAMLISFAIFSFVGGLVLLFARSEVPLWALFVTGGTFLFWAGYSRIARVSAEIRDEARRQHSKPSGLPVER